jgi:hypothetical protein
MYNVSLINLTADARSAGESLESLERPGLTTEALRALLQNFRELDAIENAVAAPEIRVRVRHERYVIRTGEKRLMLHDALQPELPAHVLTLDEMMAELDGTAAAGRRALAEQKTLAAAEAILPLPPPPRIARPASKPLLLALGAMALVLLGGIIFLHLDQGPASGPVPFVPVAATEAGELRPKLTGVYLTGNQPGHHGIVFISEREVKLFELNAVTAPSLVYASVILGRSGAKLVMATDQPGGVIEVVDQNTLTYCGENYRRVP